LPDVLTLTPSEAYGEGARQHRMAAMLHQHVNVALKMLHVELALNEAFKKVNTQLANKVQVRVHLFASALFTPTVRNKYSLTSCTLG